MQKKKILLVTSKFPYSEKESDGGMSTVSAVIASLKNDYDLSILFIRVPNDEERTIAGVKNIFLKKYNTSLQINLKEEFIITIKFLRE